MVRYAMSWIAPRACAGVLARAKTAVNAGGNAVPARTCVTARAAPDRLNASESVFKREIGEFNFGGRAKANERSVIVAVVAHGVTERPIDVGAAHRANQQDGLRCAPAHAAG